MARNPFPSFHWYPGDWLASRARATMTPEQRAAYIDLLSHAWLADPPCTLPDNDAELAGLSGLGPEKWAEAGPVIRRWFAKRRGRLVNEKLRETYREAVRIRAEKKAAGKRGGERSAEVRWNYGKTQKKEGKQNVSTAYNLLPAECNPPSPSSSPSSVKENVNVTVLASKVNGGPKSLEEHRKACRQQLVAEIIDLTGDRDSVGYFARVVLDLDEHTVRRMISETRDRASSGGLRNTAAYFTALAKREMAVSKGIGQ